jgi:hypothetical protein
MAHPFGIGEIERPPEVERLCIHVRQTASRTRCSSAKLLERQWCDTTSHGLTQSLPILLSACIFRAHREWLIEVADVLVGIQIYRHRRNVEGRSVAAFARLPRLGEDLLTLPCSLVASVERAQSREKRIPILPFATQATEIANYPEQQGHSCRVQARHFRRILTTAGAYSMNTR